MKDRERFTEFKPNFITLKLSKIQKVYLMAINRSD